MKCHAIASTTKRRQKDDRMEIIFYLFSGMILVILLYFHETVLFEILFNGHSWQQLSVV